MNFSLKSTSKVVGRLMTHRFRWVAAFFIVCIVGVGYLLFLNPKISDIRKVGVFNLQRTKDQLAIKQEVYAATKELTQRYNQLQLADLAKLKELLPEQNSIPDLFVGIEAIAIESGLKLENVGFTVAASEKTKPAVVPVNTEETEKTQQQPTPLTTGTATDAATGAVQKTSVSFTVSGGSGYADLKRFLTNIETSLRLLDVQSLAYATPGEEERYLISAIIYSLR